VCRCNGAGWRCAGAVFDRLGPDARADRLPMSLLSRAGEDADAGDDDD
jgi:hypothetical protein